MAYRPLTDIPQQFFDASGDPLAGGTLYAYLAGTSTPTNLFSDNSGTVAGTSVTLDSRGEPTTFKLIWLDTTKIYKLVLNDSLGSTIWSVDNISGDDGTGSSASSVFDQQTITATASQTLFNLGFEYVTGTNAMAVYKNGARLITGTDFAETGSTSVTLTQAAQAGDEYTFIGGQDVSSSFSSSNVSFTQSGTGATIRSVQTKLREFVSVKDFGAVGDGVTDDTAAIQAAIDYCLTFDPPKNLEVTGECLLSSSVNIDRLVDGAANDNYFIIRGGGFVVNSAINMFSSSLTYTTAPVSQLVLFDGVTFSSTDASLSAYVLHGARFLRTSFVNCSFQKIKCLVDTAVYTQSIYFINCNARRWQGIFFYCNQYNYDIQVIGGLWESGVDAFKLKNPIGCKFFTQIEGMSGTALSYDGAQGLDISMYNEQNYLDIDGTYGLTSSSTSYGVNIHGSYFAKTPTTISGATQANPVVITTTAAHGYQNGDAVYITAVGGMTQINDRSYTVAGATSTTFQLSGVNGSGYSAFVNDGNGRCHPYTIRWGATAESCISSGNWHTGAMHNITSSTNGLVVYDTAQTKLSDSSEIEILKAGYDGTYTGTLTGCTTSPTGTVRYNKTGNQVTLYIPSISGTSNATSCTITGMPTHIRPTRQQICMMRVRDNGTAEFGLCVVDTTGVLDVSRGADGNPFTNSGTKGTLVTTITYSTS